MATDAQRERIAEYLARNSKRPGRVTPREYPRDSPGFRIAKQYFGDIMTGDELATAVSYARVYDGLRASEGQIRQAVKLTASAYKEGRSKYSMGAIQEKQRWDEEGEKAEGFKVNALLSAPLTRYLEIRLPKLEGFFTKRRADCDDWPIELWEPLFDLLNGIIFNR